MFSQSFASLMQGFRVAPMQAAATSRPPTPASSSHALMADGDAKAITRAARARASAAGGSAATGSVLYVFRRTTSAPRPSKPAWSRTGHA